MQIFAEKKSEIDIRLEITSLFNLDFIKTKFGGPLHREIMPS